jgi:hypothetical protein
MTVLAITSRDLHKRVLEHGCELVRTNKHAVYRAPSGRCFAMPSPCGAVGHRKVTGAIARSAARAIGISTKELLR